VQLACWQPGPGLLCGVASLVVAGMRLTKLRLAELGVTKLVLCLLTMAESRLVEAAVVQASPARAVQRFRAGLAQRIGPTAALVRPAALVKADARRLASLAERAADLVAAESSWIGADRLEAAAVV
jgi:hypothetical protein